VPAGKDLASWPARDGPLPWLQWPQDPRCRTILRVAAGHGGPVFVDEKFRAFPADGLAEFGNESDFGGDFSCRREPRVAAHGQAEAGG